MIKRPSQIRQIILWQNIRFNGNIKRKNREGINDFFFGVKYNLTKLTQEETHNLNIPQTIYRRPKAIEETGRGLKDLLF